MNKLTCPVCSAELDLDEYHEKLQITRQKDYSL